MIQKKNNKSEKEKWDAISLFIFGEDKNISPLSLWIGICCLSFLTE